ncbi:muskelin N-terminus domain-containing protein [Encephalitozoon intestinalis]
MLNDRRSYTVIPYEIHSYSTYASVYMPSNIKKNDPMDPNSRWSTSTNDHLQYIILKIPPSLVVTITFGKYNKMHVSNVKKMRISVSGDGVEYKEVLCGGLKNDSEMETFNLLVKDETYYIAQYVKIEPLAAWGVNFSYSLWFVELRGIADVEKFARYNEMVIFGKSMRNCLKFLRDCGFRDVYEILEKRSSDKIEDEIVKHIRYLLESHKYEDTEEVLDRLDPCVFQGFIDSSPYSLVWTEIPRAEVWPCERGGHQMVEMDGSLYLYGGWNGVEELEDFWRYRGGEWSEIKMNTVSPGKRSCHRMVSYGSKLYLMGKYICLSSRKVFSGKSDIWVFDGNWRVINSDEEGGPGNIYDHQMVVVGDKLYVFGGRSTEKEDTYSGLYMFSLDERSLGYGMEVLGKCGRTNEVGKPISETDGRYRTCGQFGGKEKRSPGMAEISPSFGTGISQENMLDESNSRHEPSTSSSSLFRSRWMVIRSDTMQPSSTPSLKSRLEHSMVFIPPDYIEGSIYNNSLVVIGGQKNKSSMREMVFYRLDTDTVFQSVPFPISGEGRVVQRGLLYLNEIVVLFCHGKEKEGRFENIDVYTFSLIKKKWTEVVVKSRTEAGVDIKPAPRSAHQFVEMDGWFYLFGGNISEKVDRRVNDMWVFRLEKKTNKEIRHLSKFLVRKHKYLYLLGIDEEKAIDYLRTSVLNMVVDDDTRELFEELCHEVYRRKIFVDPVEDICRLLTTAKEY